MAPGLHDYEKSFGLMGLSKTMSADEKTTPDITQGDESVYKRGQGAKWNRARKSDFKDGSKDKKARTGENTYVCDC